MRPRGSELTFMIDKWRSSKQVAAYADSESNYTLSGTLASSAIGLRRDEQGDSP